MFQQRRCALTGGYRGEELLSEHHAGRPVRVVWEERSDAPLTEGRVPARALREEDGEGKREPGAPRG